jgi:two-component system sensor histidine kinase FlrB
MSQASATNLTLSNRSVYEILVESLPYAVIVLDKQGLVKDHNPAAIQYLGVPLKNQRWIDVINRAFAPSIEDGLEVLLRDGRKLTIATYSLPEGLGQVIIAQDVTQSRLLQAKLGHQERLISMGKMTAALAHQIRTPLASALLYGEHLVNTPMQEDKKQQFSQKILECLKNIEIQIKDMLLFVRENQFVTETISVSSLVSTFKSITSEQILHSKGLVDFKIEIKDQPIKANKEALLGALMNVIHNSIESKRNGLFLEIACKTDTVSQQLVISIKDNGPGMSEEVLKKSTEAFFTTRDNGTGLGLAVVNEVVKAHKGKMEIVSKEGKGTTVICVFPLLEKVNSVKNQTSLEAL